MDSEHEYQMFSPRQSGKPSSPIPPTQPEEGDGQTIDLAWLGSVIRRRAPVMLLATLTLGVISGSLLVWNSRRTPTSYEGAFKVLVEPVTAEGRLAKLSLLAQTGNNTGAGEISRLGIDSSDLVDYETQIRVLTSPKLMAPVIKDLQAQYPEISYNSMMEQLVISRVSYEKDGKQQGTKILEIRYRDKDPEKVDFVLDRLANIYLQYSLQERLTSLRQGIEFIDDQLPELQQRVDVLQGQLQTLRQQYSLTVPELTGKYLDERAGYLESQRVDIQADLAERRAVYASLQDQMQQGNPTSVLARESGILEAKTYDELIRQLQKIDTEIALQSSLFLESSPPIQDLREKQQNLNNLLTQEADKVLRSVAARIAELEQRDRFLAEAEREINQRINTFPTVLRRYTDLERDLVVATDSLKLFLEKREALKLDASQREIPWELIAPPELPRNKQGELIPASSKQTKRQLAVAAILSMLLGIGIGFVIEILHTVFHTPEEISAAARLRLLGVIPFAKKLKKLEGNSKKRTAELAVQGNPYSLASSGTSYEQAAFLESFRSLYTNIRLLSANKPIHSLVVGSAMSTDGKSTVAIHMALTAAAIGQRVLLVDGDLRRPQLHTRMGLLNQRGLSDVITTDLSLNDAIQRSLLEENLFVLTAGQNFSDPIKLLSSDKMQYLMEQFQAFFDLVIYDTPPLVGLADGNILAANSDGIVLVVAVEKTDRSMLMKALDGLKISGASILGVVANGAKGYTNSSYISYHRQEQKSRKRDEDVATL
ncbi:MAG: polysaccharide biosynthesis tyrosine autokinase [Kastovskya adunca ATA6-11-RM4]|nr:polysaccharide biosynthesis tyrosine autokinase [Kastovskya adunca ATA6-11-RM4]